MKKTLTIVGERTWTGPLENYEVHKECIEHWCNGGEVEFLGYDQSWKWADSKPDFYPEVEYRIKPREPKNGEVWLIEGQPCLYCEDANDGKYPFIGFDGNFAYDPYMNPVFAASSVKEYIAKQLLSECDPMNAAYEVLRKAANV